MLLEPIINGIQRVTAIHGFLSRCAVSKLGPFLLGYVLADGASEKEQLNSPASPLGVTLRSCFRRQWIHPSGTKNAEKG
jgi:hypothetical protein